MALDIVEKEIEGSDKLNTFFVQYPFKHENKKKLKCLILLTNHSNRTSKDQFVILIEIKDNYLHAIL